MTVCIVLWCLALCLIGLYCVVFDGIVLYCKVLSCETCFVLLLCIVRFCIVLYRTSAQSSSSASACVIVSDVEAAPRTPSHSAVLGASSLGSRRQRK